MALICAPLPPNPSPHYGPTWPYLLIIPAAPGRAAQAAHRLLTAAARPAPHMRGAGAARPAPPDTPPFFANKCRVPRALCVFVLPANAFSRIPALPLKPRVPFPVAPCGGDWRPPAPPNVPRRGAAGACLLYACVVDATRHVFSLRLPSPWPARSLGAAPGPLCPSCRTTVCGGAACCSPGPPKSAPGGCLFARAPQFFLGGVGRSTPCWCFFDCGDRYYGRLARLTLRPFLVWLSCPVERWGPPHG